MSDTPKKSIVSWLPIVAVVLLLAIVVAWHEKSTAPAQAPANAAAGAASIPTVKTAAVDTGILRETLPVTGSLKTNQSVDLSSKISGRIARVLVKEGDRVVRGQLLIALDDADLRAQVDAARAQLLSAQVKYRQTVVGLPAREEQVRTNIDQAQSSLETAQARYKQAQLNQPAKVQTANSAVTNALEEVHSAKTRLSQAIETEKQTDEQTASEVERARGALGASQAALADVKRGSRTQQIQEAEAQVQLQQAQLHDADTELNRSKILVAGGAAPQSTADAAQTKYNVAAAQLATSQAQLSLAKEGSTNEQIQQGEQAVRQAEASLANAQSGRSQVPIAQGQVNNARASLTQAQSDYTTAVANLSQIPVTEQDTQVARQAVAEAQSNMSQAVANRSQIPVAQEDVEAAAAAVEVAKAALQQAQVTLDYARIASPVNGVVNAKNVSAGQSVTSSVTLLNLIALDSVYFEAQVSEGNLRRVEIGQQANVVIPSISARPVAGYVSDIIPVADPKLRQFRIRIAIPRSPRELTPGAFAQGVLVTQTVTNALLVPNETIVQDNDQSVVMIAVKNGAGAVAKRRVVTLGGSADGKTEILGGLQRGDLAILGNQPLEDGDKVLLASE